MSSFKLNSHRFRLIHGRCYVNDITYWVTAKKALADTYKQRKLKEKRHTIYTCNLHSERPCPEPCCWWISFAKCIREQCVMYHWWLAARYNGSSITPPTEHVFSLHNEIKMVNHLCIRRFQQDHCEGSKLKILYSGCAFKLKEHMQWALLHLGHTLMENWVCKGFTGSRYRIVDNFSAMRGNRFKSIFSWCNRSKRAEFNFTFSAKLTTAGLC